MNSVVESQQEHQFNGQFVKRAVIKSQLKGKVENPKVIISFQLEESFQQIEPKSNNERSRTYTVRIE